MATTPAPVLPKLVGSRIKRREDPRLIQGRATYVDDLKIAGMHHLAFKRSDVAHGRIASIDVSAVTDDGGRGGCVYGRAAGGSDPADACRYTRTGRPSIGRWQPTPSAMQASPWPWWSRATGIWRAMPPTRSCVTYESAAGSGGPRAGDRRASPAWCTGRLPEQPAPGQRSRRHRSGWRLGGPLGDRQGVRRRRRGDLAAHGQSPPGASAMEPRGVVARFESGKGTMTIWSSTQSPHVLRSIIAAMFGMGQDQVRAVAPEVGGGLRPRRSTSTAKNSWRRRCPGTGAADQVDRGPVGSVCRHHPRPRHHRLRGPGGEA